MASQVFASPVEQGIGAGSDGTTLQHTLQIVGKLERRVIAVVRGSPHRFGNDPRHIPAQLFSECIDRAFTLFSNGHRRGGWRLQIPERFWIFVDVAAQRRRCAIQQLV